MALLFGRLRGRKALAWLKHRRLFAEGGAVPETEAVFVSEDGAVAFTSEDSSTTFVTEATPTP